MAYINTVNDCQLVKTEEYFIHLDDFDSSWYFDNNELVFDDNSFVSSREIIEHDLPKFQTMGIRGHFTIYGEQGEWTKYVLDDNGVQEYNPTLVWGDTLTTSISITDRDVEEQADGMFTDEQIASCMQDNKLIQNILNIMTERFLELSWEEVLQEIIKERFTAKMITLR